MNKRGFILGGAAFIAAPAIIRVAKIMPISMVSAALPRPTKIIVPLCIMQQALKMLQEEFPFRAVSDSDIAGALRDGRIADVLRIRGGLLDQD